MKQGWQIKRIGEVASIVNGGTPSTSNPKYWDGGIEWLTPKDMGKLTGKYVSFGERTISQEGVDNSSAKILPPYSVILSSRAPIGYVAINTLPMSTNQGCKGLIPSKSITAEYLLYFLLKSTKLLNDLGTGATFKELSGGKLGEILIPVPSISEQQHIVTLLDAEFAKIDALKANAEKNLQNAKDLFQAALKKELEPKNGWKRVLMGDVCVLSQGLAINSQTKHLLVEKSELPLLRIKDLRDGTREIFVNEKECPLSCRAYPDDMIYTRTGTLGLIFTGMYGVMHNNCFKIQIDREQIDKFFYMFYVQQASFKNSVLEVAQRAAQPDITHKLFKEQLFSFPSISEQKKIAQILVEVEGKCKILQANYEKTLSLCDDLKQALLRKAFNGEI